MKKILAALFLIGLLPSCELESGRRPESTIYNAESMPWNPAAEAPAGELVDGVPQPPRR